MKISRIIKKGVAALAAGLMAFSVLPATAFAENEAPDLDSVREYLTEDEIVKVSDYELEAGSDVSIENDLSGISFNKDSVKITLKSIRSSNGGGFDINKPDVYRAVYYVEPISGAPTYKVARNIIVKAPEKDAEEDDDEDHSEEAKAEKVKAEAEEEKTEEAAQAASEEAQAEAPAPIDADDEQAAQAATQAAAEATTAAAEEVLEEEIVDDVRLSASPMQLADSVTDTVPDTFKIVGKFNIEYSGFGYGDWHTKPLVAQDPAGNKYNVVCMEPPMGGYNVGDVSTTNGTETDATLLKIFYYGAYGPQNIAKTINGKKNADIVITHVAAAKHYYTSMGKGRDGEVGSWDAGISQKLKNDVNAYLEKIKSKPAPPSDYVVMRLGGNHYQNYGVAVRLGKAKITKEAFDKSIAATGRYSLGGIRIGLYTDSACKNLATSFYMGDDNSTGSVSRTISVYPGVYYVKEISSNDTYKVNNEVQKITVKGGQTASVTIKDDALINPVPIKITKKSEGADSLAGCVFKITYYKDFGFNEPVRTWYIATDEDGKAELNVDYTAKAKAVSSDYKSDAFYKTSGGTIGIPRGSVTIEEIDVPENMTMDPTFTSKRNMDGDWNKAVMTGSKVWMQVVTRDDNLSCMFINTAGGVTSQVSENFTVVNPYEKRTSISVRKVDSNHMEAVGQAFGGASLKGCEMEVINRTGGNITYKGQVIKNGEAVLTVTTNAKGTASIADLPDGTYELRETKAPKGYLLTDKTVLFSTNEGKVNVADDLITGGFSFRKVDERTKSPMANVQFKVTSKTTGESHVVTTDAKGNFNSANYDRWEGLSDKNTDKMPYDTYILEELRCDANKGYDLMEPVEFSITKDGENVDLGDLTNRKVPSVDTVLADADGNKVIPAQGSQKLTDNVKLIDFSKYLDQEVTIQDVLVDKETEEIVAENEVKAKITNPDSQTVKVEHEIDAERFDGKAIVAFAYVLDSEGNEIAKHEDINDDDQTVLIPGVTTTASVKETGSKVVPTTGGQVTVEDTVEYKGLQPATEYTSDGVLYDQTSEDIVKDKDGKPVTATVKFKTADGEGLVSGSVTVSITFTPAPGFKGKPAVMFETIKDKDGKVVAAHEDITDDDQTIYPPSVSTKAKDKDTGSNIGTISETAVIEDTVTCKALRPAEKYELKGVLMNKETGEPLLDKDGNKITASLAFTAPGEAGDEAVTLKKVLTFSFDSSLLAGKTVVVYETLYNNGIEVAVHADLEDENQTIHYPDIKTVAKDTKTGTHIGTVGEKVTARDTVTVGGLTEGKTYTLKGYFVVKVDGEKVAGTDMTQEFVFHADKDGKMDVVMTTPEFDSRALAGGAAVAFETLYDGDIEVAVHANVEDEDQTIYYPGIKTVAKDGQTGTQTGTVGKEVTAKDTVTVSGLKDGKEYTLKGYFVDKADSKKIDGTDMEQKFTFKADAEGRMEVAMETGKFSSEALAGHAIVAFETLYEDGKEIAIHADVNDKDQTIYYPEVTTDAKDSVTGNHTGTVSETAKVVDLVSCKNVLKGKTYTIDGVLMDKAKNEPLLDKEGNKITASLTFTVDGNEGEGAVDLEKELVFEFDSSLLAGKTVVVFESLKHEGIEVAVHADIEDEDQSIHYPGVKTEAKDTLTGDSVGTVTEKTTITDTVTCTGLIKGNTYKLTGEAVLKEDGSKIQWSDPDAVMEKEFVAEAETMKVEMVTPEFDSTVLKGKSAVIYETLYLDGKEIAVHADLNDVKQTIDYPDVETNALDKDTQTHTGAYSHTQVVKDRVECHNLIVGKTYTLNGALMDKATGEALLTEAGKQILADGGVVLDADGKEVKDTAKTDLADKDYEFTATAKEMEVVLSYNVDSTLLEGKSVVVFETLKHNGKDVAVHADLEDEDQTIHYPAIKTQASDKLTAAQTGTVGEKVIISDEITCTNVVNGESYTAVGKLWDVNKKALVEKDGKIVEVRKDFTAEGDTWTGVVDFEVDTTDAGGNTYVAFQELYQGDVLVAEHNLPDDKAESIYYPGIKTNAVDGQTNEHVGTVAEKATIKDKVTFQNLFVGKEYELTATPINVETGKPVTDKDGNPIVVKKTFTAKRASGYTNVVVEIDSTLLAGKKVVMFEDLYYQGTRIATHSDLKDEDQTVYYPSVKTNAAIGDKKSTEKSAATAVAKGTVKVTDYVTYAGMKPGTKGKVTGILMDASTGKALEVNGSTVTAEAEFTADKAEGTVVVEFTFDATDLGSRTLVVFEDMYVNDVKVASHADIKDPLQTVKLTKPDEPGTPGKPGNPSNPKTGDMGIYGSIAALIAAGLVAFFLMRKKKEE